MHKITTLAFCIFFFCCNSVTLANSLPLTELDVLHNANFPIGKGYPEYIKQIDGNLVYSHYDETGNSRNIVSLDFTTGKWINLVEKRTSPKLLAINSDYLILSTPSSSSFPVEVIDRKTGKTIKKIRLRNYVTAAFIDDKRLVLIQNPTGYPDYELHVAVLNLLTLKTIQETSIKGNTVLSTKNGRLATLAWSGTENQLIIFDYRLFELGRIKIPAPKDKLTNNCQVSADDFQQDGERAILISDCGEIHIIDMKSMAVKRTIPRYSNFYSAALYDGLIFTTTETQSGITIFDMASGLELLKLSIKATRLLTKGDVLLTTSAPMNGLSPNWSAHSYKINTNVIRSGEWRRQSIISECDRASQLVKNNKDIYIGINICGQSGIEGLISSGSIPSDVLPYAINYATWLSQTLHRYKDAAIIFEKLRKYGVKPEAEIAQEIELKDRVLGSIGNLGELKLNSMGVFSQALKSGIGERPILSLQLPSLGFGKW